MQHKKERTGSPRSCLFVQSGCSQIKRDPQMQKWPQVLLFTYNINDPNLLCHTDEGENYKSKPFFYRTWGSFSYLQQSFVPEYWNSVFFFLVVLPVTVHFNAGYVMVWVNCESFSKPLMCGSFPGFGCILESSSFHNLCNVFYINLLSCVKKGNDFMWKSICEESCT